MIEFPKDFFWGAAASAYQVEGGNINSDWWEWEARAGLSEPSGQACRHYELYKQDFDLAKLLNQNAHRLSVEWSRIEPKAGMFSEEGLAHYRDVIIALRQRNIEPIVTLHHFTNPAWFAKLGGWQNNKAREYFLRYVEKVAEVLCDKVSYWVTINEPLVYAYYAYILGAWPPQEKSFFKARKVTLNMVDSHIRAYRLIHSIYKKKNLAAPFVSVSAHLQAFIPCNPGLRNRLAAYLRNRFFNFEFIDRLVQGKALDFIGVNYYTRSLVDVEKWGLGNLALEVCSKNHHPLKKNSLGWDIYPQGIYTLLLKLRKYKLPVFILENGISTPDDELRWDFIRQHLKNIHQAMAEGVKVLGYIYWSLIDNFEWDKGFGPRFGLIEVDYRNFERRIRESARRFAIVCKTNALN